MPNAICAHAGTDVWNQFLVSSFERNELYRRIAFVGREEVDSASVPIPPGTLDVSVVRIRQTACVLAISITHVEFPDLIALVLVVESDVSNLFVVR